MWESPDTSPALGLEPREEWEDQMRRVKTNMHLSAFLAPAFIIRGQGQRATGPCEHNHKTNVRILLALD